MCPGHHIRKLHHVKSVANEKLFQQEDFVLIVIYGTLEEHVSNIQNGC